MFVIFIQWSTDNSWVYGVPITEWSPLNEMFLVRGFIYVNMIKSSEDSPGNFIAPWYKPQIYFHEVPILTQEDTVLSLI
jgi:hypothetical protein